MTMTLAASTYLSCLVSQFTDAVARDLSLGASSRFEMFRVRRVKSAQNRIFAAALAMSNSELRVLHLMSCSESSLVNAVGASACLVFDVPIRPPGDGSS